jgi:hypothetical protein
MPDQFLLVLTDPEEGAEDTFNEWYDTQHLREVLEIPGFVAAKRYRRTTTDGLPPGAEIDQRYLAIYEIAGDPKAAFDGLLERRESGTIVVPPFVRPSRKLGMFEAMP